MREKITMQDFSELCACLAKCSDSDAALALRKYFAGFGTLNSVDRFRILEKEKGKRCFLVSFADASDVYALMHKLSLRSYTFNGVLVELGKVQQESIVSKPMPPDVVHVANRHEPCCG